MGGGKEVSVGPGGWSGGGGRCQDCRCRNRRGEGVGGPGGANICAGLHTH